MRYSVTVIAVQNWRVLFYHNELRVWQHVRGGYLHQGASHLHVRLNLFTKPLLQLFCNSSVAFPIAVIFDRS